MQASCSNFRLKLCQTLREKCPNTEVFFGPYFPVFSPNTGKYGPEKTPYLDTFHAVKGLRVTKIVKQIKSEGVRDKLGARNCFQRQSFTKYLRYTPVFM